MNYGKELRRLREKEGISQAELARRTGNFPSTISGVENGTREISEKNFLSILKSIGYSINKKIVKINT